MRLLPRTHGPCRRGLQARVELSQQERPAVADQEQVHGDQTLNQSRATVVVPDALVILNVHRRPPPEYVALS